eukprot:CAMPEP_0176182970 /NCGR_PEP_ID=MMETSP0121_2-20121125/29_1 /TAXON_ID=160619 /ORGANISM="Kryptoperidinium foliaceum, Strain CCMP 1326" /LENGTH=48 /DNA_ID= /DNA_START= /DNA_END= /DNA_ORIENTATION=
MAPPAPPSLACTSILKRVADAADRRPEADHFDTGPPGWLQEVHADRGA